jgi:hypothetical protein
MSKNGITTFVGGLILVWVFYWFIPGLSCNDWQESGYVDKSDCIAAEAEMRSNHYNN